MTVSEVKRYADRDIMQLDRAGNHYCNHVLAMTSEGLHDKSDIAAELAFRDFELAALREELAHEQTAVDHLSDRLKAAEQRNADLEADKARIDFWQENPKYAGGFAPSGEWSFFSREYGTCYGKDLRTALDRLQVMHADLTKPTESGASE